MFPPGKRDRDARVRVCEVFIDGHRRGADAIRHAAPGLPVGLALAMADWQVLPGGEAELEDTRRLREDIFLEATAGDDFVSVNTYTRHRIGSLGWVGNEPGIELTAAGHEFWPEALEGSLRHAHAATGGRPLIATESGSRPMTMLGESTTSTVRSRRCVARSRTGSRSEGSSIGRRSTTSSGTAATRSASG